MRFTTHKRRRAPSVIIVSLIDVLLVVMIFLMVTTTFKQQQPSLKLALPESKQAKAGPADSKPFVVSVATNFPYFFLEDKPVTLDRLQNELLSAVKRDPQLKVSIKADKQAPFGEVIKIIDAAKVANVASISAITEKPARP
jgi:biopolymer transport protein ExbD